MHKVIVGVLAAVALLGATTALAQKKPTKKAPAGTVQVVLHVKAKPDQVEALRKLLTGLVAPTQAEEGCIKYELYHNIADPLDFAFIEEWKSNSLLDAHMQTKHVKAALGVIGPMIDGAIDRRIFSK